MIHETLEKLQVPIESLKPYHRNPRQGDVGAIMQSLEHHGQYRPIVVNSRTQEVLAGNHTLAAARELGWDQIAATFVDVDDDQAARIVLVDNRANDLATYDADALTTLLAELADTEQGFNGTGFDGDDLDDMLAELAGSGIAAGSGDPSPHDPPENPVTRPGDLITLGPHRLLCGDSSDQAVLDRVYSGARVGAILTDPPYGINLDTDYSSMDGKGRTYRPVHGDDKPFDASALRAYFAAVKEQFWFGADYYRRTLSDDDRDGSWLVWDKRNEESDAGFGSGFELAWSATRHKRDILRHYYFGAFGPEARDRQHPTQKPSALLAEILDRWAPEECIVADPFLGSGSTLLACENTGRSCYGLEIDPGYCDVIVDRWERHTGRTAEREAKP